MNSFESARGVELQGMLRLQPWLETKAYRGQYVVTAKGALAKELQEYFGDILFNSDPERVWGAEVKIENRYTGNLFLETWSNRNLEDCASHAARGCNPGWLVKQRADLLLYYFLDVDRLVTVPLFRLQQWAFGSADQPAQIYRQKNGIPEFHEKRQGRYEQLNDTWGRIVPISVLEREVGCKICSVQQVALLGDAA